MLTTIADLLDALRAKEVQALAHFGNVGHQGMIGDMYEGLTRGLLEHTLPRGADLRVVTGKVRMADGSFSRQMDAMLVAGDGERMPHTDHYIYAPGRVIAAVEVKKTLYGGELEDAYQNLRSLHHGDYLTQIPWDRFRFVFRRVAQMEIPASGDLTRLSWEKEMLAHVLMWEVATPVRIVFGYDGYANEYTLREGLIDYLDRAFKAGSTRGFGPGGFPSLIVCGSNSLVKLNAMPYSAVVDGTNEWLLYASSSTSPAVLLLETIWTRLHSMGLITDEWFGEDMELEQLNPLLYAKPGSPAQPGWHYRYERISRSVLAAQASAIPWEPTVVSDLEAALLHQLCAVNQLDTGNDQFWDRWKSDVGTDADETISKLRMAGIAAIDENGILGLLTERLELAAVPDVGWIAAENSTGRMTRWVSSYMKKRRA